MSWDNDDKASGKDWLYLRCDTEISPSGTSENSVLAFSIVVQVDQPSSLERELMSRGIFEKIKDPGVLIEKGFGRSKLLLGVVVGVNRGTTTEV